MRTMALREGLAKLSEQLASRTELLRNTIDASQADAIGAIDELSVKMRQREQKAQETFDQHAVGHFAPGAVDRGDLSRHHPRPPAS